MKARPDVGGYTKGPWYWDQATQELGVWSCVTGQLVALCPIGERDDGREVPDGEDEANARLCAAAPALFEALRKLLDAALKADADPEGYVAAVKAARAAVAEVGQ